jgi:sulfonate transport system permease protein
VSTTGISIKPASLGVREGKRGVLVDKTLEDLSPAKTGKDSGFPWRRWSGRVLRISVPILAIVLWQVAVSVGWVNENSLPSPETIGKAYRELWQNGTLQAALPVSLARAGTGLLIGGGLGLILGIFAGLWRIGEELFDATLQMLRTIPFIALVPLFVTWFGIGEPSKVALIASAALFPIYLNTYHAVRGTDLKLVEAGRTFGLSNRRIALRIVLPTALPGALTGLRYACSMSLLALVLAEQVNATAGIGYLIENAQNNQRPDIVIAGIWIYAVLGIAVDFFMRFLERVAVPWKPRVGLG